MSSADAEMELLHFIGAAGRAAVTATATVQAMSQGSPPYDVASAGIPMKERCSSDVLIVCESSVRGQKINRSSASSFLSIT